MRHTPWPLVQPLPSLVPIPTIRPAITSGIRPPPKAGAAAPDRAMTISAPSGRPITKAQAPMRGIEPEPIPKARAAMPETPAIPFPRPAASLPPPARSAPPPASPASGAGPRENPGSPICKQAHTALIGEFEIGHAIFIGGRPCVLRAC